MTRQRERLRRLGQWAAIVAIGVAAAMAAWRVLPAPAGTAAAFAILAVALAIGHRRMIAAPGVAILTYHSVSPDPDWLPWAREIAVHPATFERHLTTLARMRCTVLATRDHVATRAAGGAVPRDAVILHFDDGYLDNHLHAVPALLRHGFPATFFASLDFIEPGETLRDGSAGDAGYMNWAELRAIEAHAGLEVEPHGIDHGRVAISDRIVGRVTAKNWRRLAWLQWAATPGPKHDWFRAAAPAAVPIGSPVPESGLSLAAREWVDGAAESPAALAARIGRHLAICAATFGDRLGRAPAIFCWPENKACDAGRTIAATLGYRATTGGRGRNTAGEASEILSRLHMGDRALGFRWLWAEGLHLRAAVRLAQGNHYWFLLIAPMNRVRAIVMRLRSLTMLIRADRKKSCYRRQS